MGSSKNKAADQAAAAEAQRTANINRSVQSINAAYDDPRRQADIADFLGATRSFYRQNLDREKAVQDRSLKFALARSGQTGGSLAVDQSRRLGEQYLSGVLSADRQAQAQANALRDADEQSRLGLISLAQGGGDLTSGASRAGQSMLANMTGASAQRNADFLGSVFGGTAGFYENSRNAAAARRGQNDVRQWLYGGG